MTHVPNVQIAPDRWFFLLFLAFAHIFFTLDYLCKVRLTIVLLKLRLLHSFKFLSICFKFSKLATEEGKCAVEFMILFCSTSLLFILFVISWFDVSLFHLSFECCEELRVFGIEILYVIGLTFRF